MGINTNGSTFMGDYGVFAVHPSQHFIVVMAFEANLSNAFFRLFDPLVAIRNHKPFDLEILIIFAGLS